MNSSIEVIDVAGLLYDAAAGGVSWNDAGRAVATLVGARTGTLWTGDPEAGRVRVLYAAEVPAAATAAYIGHYHRLDPWTALVARTTGGGPARAWVSQEVRDVLPGGEYSAGEFYRDFGRHVGLYHVAGAILPLGNGEMAGFGLHRPEDHFEFTETDRASLDLLLPHLRRALQINRRLEEAASAAALGFAALDALRGGAVVVDAALRVVFANAAAASLAAAGNGLRFVRLGPGTCAGLAVAAAHRGEQAALAAAVAAVALGSGPGRALRLRGSAATGNAAPLAALVSPLPRRLARVAGPGDVCPGFALVLVGDTAAVASPPAHFLTDLFGLTRAEAEVAVALAGGRSAQAVAADRDIRLATVRAQVRAILDKTGAANLRDLERLLASLPGVAAG